MLNYVCLGALVLMILLVIHPPFRKGFVDNYEVGSAKFGIIPAILSAILVLVMMLLVWPVPAVIYLKEKVL